MLKRLLLGSAMLVTLLSSTFAAQSAGPVVEYGAAKIRLDAATWAALPRQEVTATDHGTKVTFEGVPLRAILALVKAPAGAEMRGAALRLVVRIEAADGYQAVYALAELDAGFRDRPILLADRRNGTPLPADAGPFQVVAADEARAGRWVRQVTRIAVISVPGLP